MIPPGLWESFTPVFYGFEACRPGHTFGPAVRNDPLVHYVLEGEGTFTVNGQTHTLYKGDLFVILPGQVTTYRASNQDPWHYAWISFSADSIPACLNTPVLRQMPVHHIFAYIRDHFREENLTGKIFSLTHELLWLLSKDQKPRQQTSSYAFYTKTYLDTFYMRRLSIQELADELHVDRRYLTALFRREYGQPPLAYLMELRLCKAKEFLEAGHRVWEAAAMAGFSDLANFSKQYKARFGITPSKEKPFWRCKKS